MGRKPVRLTLQLPLLTLLTLSALYSYANKTSKDVQQALEPRKSFAVWSEQVVGRSLVWTDEEKETAGILYLVYGKFIGSSFLLHLHFPSVPADTLPFTAVWREKESAIAASNLTSILLRNASHEGTFTSPLFSSSRALSSTKLTLYRALAVRTPLNAIIKSASFFLARCVSEFSLTSSTRSYLELALDTPLQADVREHLQHSHDASKTLLHSINDLLGRLSPLTPCSSLHGF